MTIWICGLPKSGKTRVHDELFKEGYWSETIDSFDDLKRIDFSNDLFIFIDTPTLHCWERSGINNFADYLKSPEFKEQRLIIKYIQELVYFVIKNNSEEQTLRVKIKKLIDKELI